MRRSGIARVANALASNPKHQYQLRGKKRTNRCIQEEGEITVSRRLFNRIREHVKQGHNCNYRQLEELVTEGGARDHLFSTVKKWQPSV